MQISHASVPSATVAANRAVVSDMKIANQHAAKALDLVERGASLKRIASSTLNALQAATDAFEGARALGAKNMLEPTAHRYATHALRQLTSAAERVQGERTLSRDARNLLQHDLFDAEVSTRLAHDAGERSLKRAQIRSVERGGGAADGGAPSGSGRSGWVDGEHLDELGNPTRGGDVWVGPDGQAFDNSGSAVDYGRGGDGGFTGPDGETYSGI